MSKRRCEVLEQLEQLGLNSHFFFLPVLLLGGIPSSVCAIKDNNTENYTSWRRVFGHRETKGEAINRKKRQNTFSNVTPRWLRAQIH